MPSLLTVGHGRLERTRLAGLLGRAGVDLLVDVRRFPASRTNPDVARERLAHALPEAGIGYRWAEPLGGRRHLSAGAPATDTWWTVAAFRAYAAHTRTTEFRAALERLLVEAAEAQVAVMCSESMWWRCHRRLIADVAALGAGVAVEHLMPDGTCRRHPVAAGARRRPDGLVVWDAQPDSR
ncbi:MAG: DUF488 domain-containing protein [Actinomycetota bacterium]|nr:DUF488 domain-containing protein [Actinomycetota bacterium]